MNGEINSRVPSKRVAIVSKNVFWGARSPFLAGIDRSVNRVPFRLVQYTAEETPKER